jgi:hypothetical protein
MKKYFLLSLLFIHVITIVYINTNAISGLNKSFVAFKSSQHVMSVFKDGFDILPTEALIALHSYSMYSGITGYCFFSPEPLVGTKLFVETEDENHHITTTDLQAHSFEGANKFATAYNFILTVNGADLDSDSLTAVCATSMAARLFEKHPNAVKINLYSPAYNLPSMADFRRGEQATYHQSTRYEFKKNL